MIKDENVIKIRFYLLIKLLCFLRFTKHIERLQNKAEDNKLSNKVSIIYYVSSEERADVPS